MVFSDPRRPQSGQSGDITSASNGSGAAGISPSPSPYSMNFPSGKHRASPGQRTHRAASPLFFQSPGGRHGSLQGVRGGSDGSPRTAPVLTFTEFLQSTGHNLQVVHTNPRASWGDVFYEAWNSTGNSNDYTEDVRKTRRPSVSSEGSAELEDFLPFLQRCGDLSRTYFRNHRAKPKRNAVQKGAGLLTSEQAAADAARCFQSIPKVYLSAKYNLHDTDVFDKIVSSSDDNTIEKLTYYLDRVEGSLLRQLEARSDSFFKAMTSHDALRVQVAAACQKVSGLRNNMKSVHSSLVTRSLRIVRLEQRRQKLATLQDTFVQVEEAKNAPEVLQALLRVRDYDGALDVIQSTRQRLAGPLQRVSSLRFLPAKLEEYCEFVGEQLAQEFLKVVNSHDWEMETDAVGEGEAASTTMGRRTTIVSERHEEGEPPASGSRATGSAREDNIVAAIRPTILGLARVNLVRRVLERFALSLQSEIRVVLRTVLAETMETYQSTAEGSVISDVVRDREADSKVAAQLRALDAETFLSCLRIALEHTLSVLKKGVVVQEAVLILIKEMEKHSEDGAAVGKEESEEEESEEGEEENAVADENEGERMKEVGEGKKEEGEEEQCRDLHQGRQEKEREGQHRRRERRGKRMRNGKKSGAAAHPSSSPPPSSSAPGSSATEPQSLSVIHLSSLKEAEIGCVACLRTVADFAHKSISQLLALRKEVQARYSLAQLRELWDTVMAFGQETESLSGTTGYALRGALLQQLKRFLEVFHKERKEALQSTLLKEKWKLTLVSSARQSSLDALTKAAAPPPSPSSPSHAFFIAAGQTRAGPGDDIGRGRGHVNTTHLPTESKQQSHQGPSHRAAREACSGIQSTTNGGGTASTTDLHSSASTSTSSGTSKGSGSIYNDSISRGSISNNSGSGGDTASGSHNDVLPVQEGSEAVSETTFSRRSSSSFSALEREGEDGGAEDGSSTAGLSLRIDKAKTEKFAVVDGARFRVVWSCLYLMELLGMYLACVGHFPILATDVLQKIVDILRFFNSRTTQLVLGAGAMQVAGLKSITAKHLALSSQCLGLVLAELPHLKAALSVHLQPKQRTLLKEVDKVAEDFSMHMESIFAKFVTIVEELLERNLGGGRWEHQEWDGSEDMPAPSQPLQSIVRGTLTLHKVLQQVLPPEQVQEIFSRICGMIVQKMPLQWSGEAPNTDVGRQRVINDLSCVAKALQALPGVQLLGAPQIVEEFRRKKLLRGRRHKTDKNAKNDTTGGGANKKEEEQQNNNGVRETESALQRVKSTSLEEFTRNRQLDGAGGSTVDRQELASNGGLGKSVSQSAKKGSTEQRAVGAAD